MLPYYPYSSFPKLLKHKTWAEIDTDALIHNFRFLSSLSSSKKIAAVKADAYGHVADICVRTLLGEGCGFFAVSSIEEAISVRLICIEEKTDADVLILGYTDPSQAEFLAQMNIIQSVISRSYADTLSENAEKLGLRIRAHIAVDTGMNRIGICARDDKECISAAEEIKEICGYKGLICEGIFSHFAKADTDTELTKKQFKCFDSVRSILSSQGVGLFAHISNSAATVLYPEYSLSAVRLGIALYGVDPIGNSCELLPVMSLHTVISHIHTLQKGESVGYGGDYTADSERRIATLPIGYGDGILRTLSGALLTLHTESGSHKVPIVGRICMDQCMVDVTDTDADIGDKVTLFGEDSKDLTLLAKKANTIEYEILTLISARVPRIIKEVKK